MVKGLSGNEIVVGANRLSNPLKFAADITCNMRVIAVKRQNSRCCQKQFEPARVALDLFTLGDAITQFKDNDGR